MSNEVNIQARKALYAAFIGYMLDGFDYMIFTLSLALIIKAFQLSTGQAGLLATASLFISAFGGLFAGTLSDYIGRVRTLAITIVLYAVFTGLTGLATNYQQLFIYRALEGLGFGGAWAAGAALVSESAPADRRGRWLGWMQSSWALGWGLALIVYLIFSSISHGENGWRILFIIGALPALFIFYILRQVKEPEIWLQTMEMKRKLKQEKFQTENKESLRQKIISLTFFQLWAPDLIGRTLVGLLLSTGALFGYYSIFTFLPTYLQKVRHLTAVGSGPYLAMVVIGSFIGYLTSGWLNDKLGRRKNFLFFSIGSAIIILLYTYIIQNNSILILLSLPLGFFASGIFSGFGSYLAELFPSRVRGAAQGFVYNGGRAIASSGPALIGYLSSSLGGLGQAITIFGPASYLLCVIAILLLPETKGKELKALD
jgi:MFS family permease